MKTLNATVYKEQRKHVFKASEIEHIWAQQKLASGRNPQGNVFFEGPSLFSYGHHFETARFVKPGVVFITTRTYSSTTAGHVRAARSAVSHLKRYDVKTMDDHDANIDAFLADATAHLTGLDKKFYVSTEIKQAKEIIRTAASYCKEFKSFVSIDRRKKVSALVRNIDRLVPADKLKVMLAKEAKFQAGSVARRQSAENARHLRWQRETEENKARWAKQDKERKELELALELWGPEIQALNLDAWRAGLDMPGNWREYDAPVILRKVDNEIETSQGAIVPVADAVVLWEKMRAGEVIAGFSVGHYTVTGIHDQKLVVGCHRIPVKEVARMAVTLGLESEAK